MSTSPEVFTTANVVVQVADVYWRPGCPYCAALRRDLSRLKVPTRWHNIWDDPAASQFVRSVNAGNETVPTVRVGSTTLTNPRAEQVATLVGVQADLRPQSTRGPMGSVVGADGGACHRERVCGPRRSCWGGLGAGWARGCRLVGHPTPSPVKAIDSRRGGQVARLPVRAEGVSPLTDWSPTARTVWPAIAVAGAVLAADVVSKAWALRQVPSESSASTAIVQLRHVANRGASFGLGAQHPIVVVVLALVATLAVGWWLTKSDSAGERTAVAAVLGGALGNLIDRLANGAVTDWVGIAWYPATFNLADVAIRGGAVVALVLREVHRRRAPRTVAGLP